MQVKHRLDAFLTSARPPYGGSITYGPGQGHCWIGISQREMMNQMAGVKMEPPKVSLYANVTAAPVDSPDTIRELPVEQITGMVRWRESVAALAGAGVTHFVEFGGKVLGPMVKRIAPADPITCAANLKDRRLLMLAGKRDDIVPPKMAEALWQASGKQKIVWYDCTHYGAVLYLAPALQQVLAHFTAD